MSDDGGQSVEFALTARDYVAYTRTTMKRRPWTKLIIGLGIATLVLVWLPELLTYQASGGWGFQIGDVPAIIVCLGAILIVPITGLVARLKFHSSGFAKFRAPVRVEISPAGIRKTGGIADSLTPWSSVIDIVQTPVAVYLFIVKHYAHIVPWHAFADKEAFDRFAAAARAYWRPRD
jgi:hypothetical protein